MSPYRSGVTTAREQPLNPIPLAAVIGARLLLMAAHLDPTVIATAAFILLLASICSRPNTEKMRRTLFGPPLEFVPVREGEDPGTRGRKRENTIRQSARCISDTHAADPNAAQSIVTNATLSGCVAGCPVMVNMEGGRIAVPSSPKQESLSSAINPFAYHEPISVVTPALPSE